MDFLHIKNLPFGWEIIQDKHGFNLMKDGKCLGCWETLEVSFDVMCKVNMELKNG